MTKQFKTDFQACYAVVKEAWLIEWAKGLHSHVGLDTELAKVLGWHNSVVSLCKNGKGGSWVGRLRAKDYAAISKRFDIPILELMAAVLEGSRDE